jgi:PAS domain S-box-containing protein
MNHANLLQTKTHALSPWMLPRQVLPTPQRYGNALLVTVAVLLAELALTSVTKTVPVFFALFAVLFSAWFYGRGPGLLSAGVSLLTSAYLRLISFTSPEDLALSSVASLTSFGLLATGMACVIAQIGYRIEDLEAQIQLQQRQAAESHEQFQDEARQRSETQAALREREAHYRAIVETSYEGILQVGHDGRVVFANQRMAELVGHSLAALRNRPLAELLPSEECSELLERLTGRRLDGHEQYECRLRHRSGADVWVAVSAGPLYSAEGSFSGTLAMFTDVTERKVTEIALREAEARFAAFMENLPAVAVIRDEHGAYVTTSRSYERSFGKGPAELIGKTPFDMFPPEVAQQLLEHEQEVLRDGKTRQFTQFVPGADGKTRELLTDKFLLTDEAGRRYVGSIAVDITAQRALEEQLRQSQKMDAIGRLAGGVAHDFNNMLAVILGYTEVLSWRRDLPKDVLDLLRQVHTAGQRAAALTRQLLAFSRRQIVAPKNMDLGEAVSSCSNMLRRLIGEDIELETVLSHCPARIHADPSQVEQVLWNLVVNSRDAMPTGGKLTIETQNVRLDDIYAMQHVGVTPGEYVMLAVSDTGVGMTAATRERIFEPFFTTKELGRGTGLGLATVFGIVQQSNGHIHVYSEPGHGTTFKVYFPRIDIPEETPAAAAQSVSLPRGSETVLLVEDEEIVRAVARRVLEQAGYTVLEADTGEAALQRLAGHTGSVDLVVSDVVMPQMSGRELVEELKAAWPNVRPLLMSGYTDDAIVRHGILSAETAFIQKPFTALDLARKVRETLDAPHAQR